MWHLIRQCRCWCSALSDASIKYPDKIPNESIMHVEEVNLDGKRWHLTQQQAISYMESGGYETFVHVDGIASHAIVVTSSEEINIS